MLNSVVGCCCCGSVESGVDAVEGIIVPVGDINSSNINPQLIPFFFKAKLFYK